MKAVVGRIVVVAVAVLLMAILVHGAHHDLRGWQLVWLVPGPCLRALASMHKREAGSSGGLAVREQL